MMLLIFSSILLTAVFTFSLTIFKTLSCTACLTAYIDAKSPAFGWRLQLSDSISSSPAEQAKSPAELRLTNFVIHISCELLFHKRKTVHDLRNREIYEKSAAN